MFCASLVIWSIYYLLFLVDDINSKSIFGSWSQIHSVLNNVISIVALESLRLDYLIFAFY